MQSSFQARAYDYRQRSSRHGPPQPAMDGEQPRPAKKPKFEQDFIILSEFSEQVGPVPVKIIPSDAAKGEFDTSRFSVRIMSSDYSNTVGQFSVSEDTQVILSQKQDGAYAYVHYFCLFDVFARGYVRQYCLSYVSSSLSKIIDNFSEILERFCEVTAILKCANHKLFCKDLEHQLADLQHTLELIQREGWTTSEEVDPSQLYQGFDFASQDVPERDPSNVEHSLSDTHNMLQVMQKELTSERHAEACREIEQRRRSLRLERQQQTQRANILLAESPTVKRDGNFVSYLQTGAPPDEQSLSDLSTCSSDLAHYEPQRVMAHIVHKFERRLRQLEELAPKTYKITLQSLLNIHKNFNRSEQALEVEKVEALLLDPRSSLLTIGRVPVLNILQTFNPPSHTHSMFQTTPHTITCRNTWGLPGDFPSGGADSEEGEASSGFDTTFLEEKSLLNKCPLYLDASRRTSTVECRPSAYSLAMSVDYSESSAVDFDHTLTQSLKQPLESSSTSNTDTLLPHNMEEEETISHDSSTYNTPQIFATPKTGMTPTSSNEGEEEEEGEGGKLGGGGGGDESLKLLWPGRVNGGGGGEDVEVPRVMVWSSGGESGEGVKASRDSLTNSDDFSKEDTIGFLADSNPNLKSVEVAPTKSDSTPKPDQVPILDPIPPVKQSRQSVLEPPTAHGLLNHTPSPAASQQTDEAVTMSGSKESTPEMKRRGSPKLDPRRLLRSSKSPTFNRKVSKERNDRGSSINNEMTSSIVSFTHDSWETWNKAGSPGNHTEEEEEATKQGDSSRAENGSSSREEQLSAGSGQYGLQQNSLRTQQQQKLGTAEQSSLDSDLQRTPVQQQRHAHYANPAPHSSESPAAATGKRSQSSSSSPVFQVGGGGVPSSPGFGRNNGVGQRSEFTGKTTPPSDLRFGSKTQASPERFYSPVSGPVGAFAVPGASLMSSPSQRSLALSVADKSVYRGPSIVELLGKGRLPLVSSLDHTEGSYKFKPGKGIINFCKESPNFRDMLYCLLHGRPLALIGRSSDEHLIRRIIRVLWLFVPGHSSHQQIVAWQTTPLEIQDLSRVKLIGLCYHTCYPLASHIKRYVSYWDCMSGRLYTPQYNGELLKPIVSRTKDRKTEEVFLIHTHSVLLDMAMKAFVYYHGYCVATSSQLRRQPSTSEASPKKFHTVEPSRKTRPQFLQMLGVKGSDMDIIEYFTEVIRTQQLSAKHIYNGTPQDDVPGPVPMFLYNKQCTESYSKPKRPF